MKYKIDNYTFEKITEDNQERVLCIYEDNPEYFQLSSNQLATLKNVQDDMEALPPNIDTSQKNYMLVLDRFADIGVVDFITDYPEKGSVYIGLLMIKKEIQNKGLGSHIFKYLETIFKDTDYKEIRLGVLKNNNRALDFWSKNGFNIISETNSTNHPERNWQLYSMNKFITD